MAGEKWVFNNYYADIEILDSGSWLMTMAPGAQGLRF